eukprot:310414_1
MDTATGTFNDDTNPKQWASCKRQQRYNDPYTKRKANTNGHSLRKIATDYYYTKNSELFGFEKNIQLPQQDGSYTSKKPKIYGTTGFEEMLNINMVTKKRYSLNKHKNWERIPQIIDKADADEKWQVIRGKSSKNVDKSWNIRECDRTYLAYFDMDELQNKMEQIAKAQHQ